MKKNVYGTHGTEVNIVNNKQVVKFVRVNHMQCK